jgi:hypothetical protein
MEDCHLCAHTPITRENTVAYLVSNKRQAEVPASLYKSRTLITVEPPTDFKTDTRFTAKARLTLTIAEATEFLHHKQAWREFLVTKDTKCGAIFDSTDIDSEKRTRQIVSFDLPKDWDVLFITATQYVLTRRAASLLLNSCSQIHHPLTTYIKSIPFLKIIYLK